MRVWNLNMLEWADMRMWTTASFKQLIRQLVPSLDALLIFFFFISGDLETARQEVVKLNYFSKIDEFIKERESWD